MKANPQLYEAPPQVEEGEEVSGKVLDAAPVPSTASYFAEFDCKELPDEGYMQLELIGKNEGQIHADLKFVIKVIFLSSLCSKPSIHNFRYLQPYSAGLV
jgi:hypothetical protein